MKVKLQYLLYHLYLQVVKCPSGIEYIVLFFSLDPDLNSILTILKYENSTQKCVYIFRTIIL